MDQEMDTTRPEEVVLTAEEVEALYEPESDSKNEADDSICTDADQRNCCGMLEKEIIYSDFEEDKCILITNGNNPLTLSCTGRFLTLAVKLRTCPRKKINIGIVLYDVQTNEALGYEVQQFSTGEPQGTQGTVFGPFRFVFPEPSGVLPKRLLKVCIIAHYCDLY